MSTNLAYPPKDQSEFQESQTLIEFVQKTSTVLFHCHLVAKVWPSRLLPPGRRKKEGFISDKAFEMEQFDN